MTKKGVIIFIVATFGVSWAWMFCAGLLLNISLVNPLAQLPIGLTPAIVAVIVRAWVTKEGFPDAGLALRLRKGWPYYLAAWLGPLLFAGVAVASAAALGLSRVDLAPLDSLLPVQSPGASVLIWMMIMIPLTPVFWGEEFGWTSYLRPRLFPERPLLSAGATGIIWAVWHYPLAFVGYIHFGNIFLGLLIWTLSFLCQEIILAWLYQSSRSIWTASLAHAGNNLVLFLFVGQLLKEASALVITTYATIPLAVVAAWIVFTGRLTKPQSQRNTTWRTGAFAAPVFPRSLLVFDGDCAFCTSSVDTIRARIRPDVDFEPWQWLELSELGLTEEQVDRSVQWLNGEGGRASGAKAFAKVLLHAAWPWRIAGMIMLVPPVSWLAGAVYRLIANNRHRMPGGTPACAVRIARGD
ncbi:DCC1-like thiol-disulfide oxidoreductase family protein [Nocardia sp. NPDC051052]|uniref:DCC1-like thiol-disulfide oxidoreductase family protein n=1 Tax=Nocardia sp. NPDC051052 TaxID=3364322 RepID=UPI0037B2AEFE